MTTREQLKFVGHGSPTTDAAEKVSGEALFGADVMFPDMLHGAVLMSDRAHAVIKRIDTSRALALPGVQAVITGEDLPDIRFGTRDEGYVLARGKVTCAGQRVAAVAAEDPDTAQEAAALIKVEYEDLPLFLDPEEAARPDAPAIFPWADTSFVSDERFGPNVFVRQVHQQGDVERGLAQADYVFEDVFETGRFHQCYLEPHVAVARVDAGGMINVWTTTQGHFRIRDETAQVLGIPLARLDVYATQIGGGFGGKNPITVEPICVALAQRTGRPVQVNMSRFEEMVGAQTRAASRIYLKTGVKKDGTFTARWGRAFYSCGAVGIITPARSEYLAGCYRFPHFFAESMGVYTNHIPASSYRAPGGPQAGFAGESQIDMIAARLEMDPVELRLKNAMQRGDVHVTGQKFVVCGFSDTLKAVDKAARKVGCTPGSPGPKSAPRGGKVRAWGIGCAPWWGASMNSAAQITVNTDDTVGVATGSVDLTGTNVVFAQIVAEKLGVTPENISVTVPPTSGIPYTEGSVGSRTALMTGIVVEQATDRVITGLFEMYAELTGAPKDRLVIGDGEVNIEGGSEPGIGIGTLAEASQAAGHGAIASTVTLSDLERLPSFAVQAAEVEVDLETGRIRVLRLILGQDVGTALNPLLVEGQMEGAATQSLGAAIMEDLIIGADGRVQNPTLLDYMTPTALDTPPMDCIIVETAPGLGPYGAKGVGEPPIIPAGPAIASAVFNATGVRVKRLPITPEVLWRAMREARGDQAAD